MIADTLGLLLIFRITYEAVYRDVRQNLKVAQRGQKDAYNKKVKHAVFQTGDLVWHYTLQLKPGEAGKFHIQWEGPYEIVAQVGDVAYQVRNVLGCSRWSKVGHFNNLLLYQREEGGMKEATVSGRGSGP